VTVAAKSWTVHSGRDWEESVPLSNARALCEGGMEYKAPGRPNLAQFVTA